MMIDAYGTALDFISGSPRMATILMRWRTKLVGGSLMYPHHHRAVVTSSFPPPLNVRIERPEMVVLAESSLYKHSWKDSATKFYPLNGLHFSSIEIMQSSFEEEGDHSTTTIKSLVQNLSKDLSNLGDVSSDVVYDDVHASSRTLPNSSSAHVVLIARGPLQCLISQYFLESLPLAGLVLVDPLLLPDDGRLKEKTQIELDESVSRWKSSLLDLISLLENKAPQMYTNISQQSREKEHVDGSPLLIQSTTENGDAMSSELEMSLLQSLANKDQHVHPLKLEPGSVPILVLYSGGDHAYHDYYRICAERTAARHTCSGSGDYFDQVSVIKIAPTNTLDEVMQRIYEWYDVLP